MAAAFALALALVAYPALATDGPAAPLWGLGAGGVLFLLVGMATGFVPVAGVALATLALEFGIAADELGHELDTRVVVWGAGLLLLAELAFLAAELRTAVTEGGDLIARRLGTLVGLVVGSVVLGALLLGVAAVEPPGGLWVQVVGVAATAGVLALVMSLARR
ncbi:MAG: hypothetical protein ABR583_11345 [Gaiellaceae bacterium]